MNNSEKRSKVLASLEKSFTEELVPASIIKEESVGVEVLNLMLEDLVEEGHVSYGEFFFLPDTEDSDMTIFESVITVTGELGKDTIGDLCVAVAAINYFVTSGAFAVDVEGGRLLYRHSVELGNEVTKEELLSACDMNMSISMQMAAHYADQLLDVADGDRDAASVIEFYTGKGLS